MLYRVKNHKPKKQPQSKDCEESSCEEGEVDSKETSKKEVLKSTVSVRPRKRKVTSQKDAISQLSATFENLQKAHEKRMQIWFEADQKREETFLQYQEKQAELNRQHELRMMEMMTRFQQPGNHTKMLGRCMNQHFQVPFLEQRVNNHTTQI